MTKTYLHFSSLRDAKTKLGQNTCGVEFEFFKAREGYSIFRVRLAGSLTFVGTIYEGPDCLLFTPHYTLAKVT